MTGRLILHCRTTHLETQPHPISASLAEKQETMVPLRLTALINYTFAAPIYHASSNHTVFPIRIVTSIDPWSMLQCISKSLIEVPNATVPRAVRHHSASIPRPDHDLTAMHLMHTASDHSPTYPQPEPPSHRASISALRSWIQNAATEAPNLQLQPLPSPPKTSSPPRPGESLRVTHGLQIFVMNYWTATRPAD
jgi:hypothetical protein